MMGSPSGEHPVPRSAYPPAAGLWNLGSYRSYRTLPVPHGSIRESTSKSEPTVLGAQRAVKLMGRGSFSAGTSCLPAGWLGRDTAHPPYPTPHHLHICNLALWSQTARSTRMAGPTWWVCKDIKMSTQCASKLPEKARVGGRSRAKLSAGRGEPPAEREAQEGFGPPN